MLYLQYKGLLDTAGMNKPLRVVAFYHNKEFSGATTRFYPDSRPPALLTPLVQVSILEVIPKMR